MDATEQDDIMLIDDAEDGITASRARPLGDPSLIAEDVHVEYKVFGGRRVASEPGNFVQRALNRGRGHVGAVSTVHAIRGVSFVAHHGESIGLVGLNGAGKSTLLRALAGLMPLSSGQVYTHGTTSLLGVNAALMPQLSGERNIMIGCLALGLTRKEVEDRFDDIVEFSGIGDFVKLPMSAYSSGMGARLRFAISTAVVPDVLMIDEALATGDAEFRERSQGRIEEIRDQAGTVFVVSHSAVTVARMCTRALWLEKGELVMDGPAEEVVDEYRQDVRRRAAKARGAR